MNTRFFWLLFGMDNPVRQSHAERRPLCFPTTGGVQRSAMDVRVVADDGEA